MVALVEFDALSHKTQKMQRYDLNKLHVTNPRSLIDVTNHEFNDNFQNPNFK